MRYLWYSMYAFATALALYAVLLRPDANQKPDPSPTVAIEKAPDVQIALLLDTSSSMDGLVAQARSQMWEMVSEMQVDEEGNERRVALALYQYGNNRLSVESGFLEQLSGLTTDLDLVHNQLQWISTSGGQEYAPLAIHRAIQELEWATDDNTERIIVIAGNENFGQGPLQSEAVLQTAAKHGIKVIPIYCANRGSTIAKGALLSWQSAATLAGADFHSIDPDRTVAEIESPYDKQILEKYRAFEQAQGGAPRETPKMDGTSEVERALVYSRQGRADDVLAAYRQSGQVRKETLPASVQNASLAEQKQYLETQLQNQDKLKRELGELSNLRRQHIDQKSRNKGVATPKSLGSAFKQTVQK